MKTILTLFFVLLFAFGTCFGQDTALYRKLNVKSCTLMTEAYLNGMVKEKEYIESTDYYNESQLLDSSFDLSSEGGVWEKTYWKYNNNGYSVITWGKFYKDEGTLKDSLGLFSGNPSYGQIPKGEQGDTLFYAIRVNDSLGNVIEGVSKNFKIERITYTTTAKEVNGRVTTYRTYSFKGDLLFTKTKKYNKDNILVEEMDTNTRLKSGGRISYFYNEAGDLIKKIDSSKYTGTIIHIYEYDKVLIKKTEKKNSLYVKSNSVCTYDYAKDSSYTQTCITKSKIKSKRRFYEKTKNKTVANYNSKGKLNYNYSITNHDTVYKTQYLNGKMICRIWYMNDGDTSSYSTYDYNDKGLISSDKTTDISIFGETENKKSKIEIERRVVISKYIYTYYE